MRWQLTTMISNITYLYITCWRETGFLIIILFISCVSLCVSLLFVISLILGSYYYVHDFFAKWKKKLATDWEPGWQKITKSGHNTCKRRVHCSQQSWWSTRIESKPRRENDQVWKKAFIKTSFFFSCVWVLCHDNVCTSSLFTCGITSKKEKYIWAHTDAHNAT